MQISAQKVTPTLLELDVEITAERVKQELDKAYEQLARKARVPGFRPGRAPRQILTQMFGPRVRADVAQRLLDSTYPEALQKQSVQTVSDPVFEASKLDETGSFTYRARVEVLPEIEKVNYDGLVAKKPSIEVTEEALGARLEDLRRQNSRLEPLAEERGLENGDVASIDIVVAINGKEIADAAAKNLQVELGQRQVLSELETALVGRKVGETVDVDTQFGASHPNPKLKSKKAKLSATIKDVKRRVLPDLDDEFAKDLGEHGTLDELKAELSGEIVKELEEQAEQQIAEQLVAELVKANPIQAPRSLVERQSQVTVRELLRQAGRGEDAADQLTAEARASVARDSELKVRAGLLMAQIAKTEGIKIGEAEITEALEELATQSGKNVAKLRAEYREASKREMLMGMILEHKVLDIIQSKAKIEQS